MPAGRNWQKHTVAWSCTATSVGRATLCASELERPFTFGGASPYGPAGCPRCCAPQLPRQFSGVEQAEEDQYASVHPSLSAIAYRSLCPRSRTFTAVLS